MFHRINVEEWQSTLTIISFMLFFSTFAIAFLRVAAMKKHELGHLENLPLQADEGDAHE